MTISGTPIETRAIDVELYSGMALIRRFEEAAYRAYETGEVAGTIHASIGQEAVAVGVISALATEDLVLTHHRAHGHALAKGVDPTRLMAELLGRRDGVSGGKGGSMHTTERAVGFLGSMAVVGGSIPLSVGVALAARQRGEDAVVAVFFGDGAINQGVLYESFNLASIWSLPVLFVCENNGYAISVASTYATAGPGLVERAQAFDVPGRSVDGQSVASVRAAADQLIPEVRAGRPAVLEALTYRLVGHSRGDPVHGLYRSEEEVASWRERDPLVVHAAEAGLSAEQCATVDAEASQRVEAALEQARANPEPRSDQVMTEVWGE